MSDPNVDPAEEIARLREQLLAAERERDEYKRAVFALLDHFDPVDLSEDFLSDPPGTPIAQVVAEFVQRHQG
jgi:hypothetical protein